MFLPVVIKSKSVDPSCNKMMFDVYPRGFSYVVGEEFPAFQFMHTVTLQDLLIVGITQLQM